MMELLNVKWPSKPDPPKEVDYETQMKMAIEASLQDSK